MPVRVADVLQAIDGRVSIEDIDAVMVRIIEQH
jgi:hypothetical protein